MSQSKHPITIVAKDAPPRAKPTSPPFPPEMVARVASGRDKRPLGDLFGLTNFGVNLTTLHPGGESSLRHAHAKQDEFVYVVSGHPTLHTDEGRTRLAPGMCAGFKAGTGNAHRLINETSQEVVYLEFGDRTPGEAVVYPDDDIAAVFADGKWKVKH